MIVLISDDAVGFLPVKAWGPSSLPAQSTQSATPLALHQVHCSAGFFLISRRYSSKAGCTIHVTVLFYYSAKGTPAGAQSSQQITLKLGSHKGFCEVHGACIACALTKRFSTFPGMNDILLV